MSTEEKPDTPPLTRRQLRELRNTGATPIIAEGAPATPPVAPPPRAAAPVELAPAFSDVDIDIDIDGLPRTRRQARLLERVRTASIPVIIDDIAASEHRTVDAVEPDVAHDETDETVAHAEAETEEVEHDVVGTADADEQVAEAEVEESPTPEDEADAPAEDEEPADEEPAAASGAAEHEQPESAPEDEQSIDDEAESAHEDEAPAEAVPPADAPLELTDAAREAVEREEQEDGDRRLLSASFGAELLAEDDGQPHLRPSFDESFTRDTTATGSATAPSALILSKVPDVTALNAPIAATGEVLVTGTLSFPESFGATGVVPGASDGEEVDALLVDREIPAASSPTPIAASAAVSTVKSADEIIQPPAPEKGGRLMMVLAITAGALALALAGVLILGFASGVFG
ncbi:hypothetical protein [Microbacterium sp. No. 7]|uniref:hypothetical protein n=1 Tax=Microbacterium sp. No. 7 TaxID=1714373 RepID=UPI0006D19EDC|nr:hypothetical protein [Microbacterium sp. No. 7]ALJ20650.1 hypothetical protein AOA12_12370 [Microbacterium sp. No. 7]